MLVIALLTTSTSTNNYKTTIYCMHVKLITVCVM